MSVLVAIDTSTDTASLALARDGVALAELTWRSGKNHTTQLPPNLEQLLKLTGIAAVEITGVIVAKGPGSFNGLRVGVSFAKGLAYALGVPIVGVGTLEVAAYQYALTGLPVCPVFTAGRGEVATALFRLDGEGWWQLQPEHVATVEQLCAGTEERTLFCGDFPSTSLRASLPEIAAQLKNLLGEKAVIASPVTDMRRAGYLMELGMKRLGVGDADGVATLQPVYLRRPPITVAKHR